MVENKFVPAKISEKDFERLAADLINRYYYEVLQTRYFLRGQIIDLAIRLERELDLLLINHLKRNPEKIQEVILNDFTIGRKVKLFKNLELDKDPVAKKLVPDLPKGLAHAVKIRNLIAHEDLNKPKNKNSTLEEVTKTKPEAVFDSFSTVTRDLERLNIKLKNRKGKSLFYSDELLRTIMSLRKEKLKKQKTHKKKE